MTSMTIVTPSYRADYELCADLNRSILEFAPEHVHHHILVPRSDFDLFSRLGGARTHVRCREELLPPTFLRLPFTDFMVNLRSPFIPIRGWIEQQIVKLAAASTCTEDVVLLVDSDVEFVRPFSVDTFLRRGSVRFYRLPNGVEARLPRHLIWHECARRLLGISEGRPPYADYVHGMIACDPEVVRRMLARIQGTTGVGWATAIGKQLHFSEWTLYGVFVDEVAGPPANAFVSDDPLCRGHWTTPFEMDDAEEFLAQLRPSDVAAMISSKTGTSLAVRRAAFANSRTTRSAFEYMVNLPLYFAIQAFGMWCGVASAL